MMALDHIRYSKAERRQRRALASLYIQVGISVAAGVAALAILAILLFPSLAQAGAVTCQRFGSASRCSDGSEAHRWGSATVIERGRHRTVCRHFGSATRCEEER